MVRLYVLLAIFAIIFIVYTLVDAVLTPQARVKTLPKRLWIPIIVLLPVLGGILWLIFGKGRAQQKGSAYDSAPGGSGAAAAETQKQREVLRKERLAQSDKTISELEKRLAELDAEAAAAEGATETAQNSDNSVEKTQTAAPPVADKSELDEH